MRELKRYGIGLVLMAVAAAGCGAPEGEDAASQDEVAKAALSVPIGFTIFQGTIVNRVPDLVSFTVSATEVSFIHAADSFDTTLFGWVTKGTLFSQILFGDSSSSLSRRNVRLNSCSTVSSAHSGTPMVQCRFQ